MALRSDTAQVRSLLHMLQSSRDASGSKAGLSSENRAADGFRERGDSAAGSGEPSRKKSKKERKRLERGKEVVFLGRTQAGVLKQAVLKVGTQQLRWFVSMCLSATSCIFLLLAAHSAPFTLLLQASRVLMGLEEERAVRVRPPRIAKHELSLLDAIENRITLWPLCVEVGAHDSAVPSCEHNDHQYHTHQALPLPEPNLPAHHDKKRSEWMNIKKLPQIHWMLRQLQVHIHDRVHAFACLWVRVCLVELSSSFMVCSAGDC
jgi:hypothetical protein